MKGFIQNARIAKNWAKNNCNNELKLSCYSMASPDNEKFSILTELKMII